MDRRHFLSGLGVGVTALSAGCNGVLNLFDTPNHTVSVFNSTEETHEVTVECELNGEVHENGPKLVEPEERWEVKRFESEGELSISVFIDGELQSETTHEISTLGGNRSSLSQITIQTEDEEVGVLFEHLEEQ